MQMFRCRQTDGDGDMQMEIYRCVGVNRRADANVQIEVRKYGFRCVNFDESMWM